MQTESLAAKDVSAAADKAAYDNACKRLLANKSILAWILKECACEYKDCSVKDIAEKYIEGEPKVSDTPVHKDEVKTESIVGRNTEDGSLFEGTVTYDIYFDASAPSTGEPIRLIINIEAQNDFYPGYPLIKRGIYYCSRMLSAQHGSVFTESHYGDMRKVYSIWICTNPPKSRRGTISRYHLAEECVVGESREKPESYDMLNIVMICLGNPEDSSGGVIKLLDVLISSEMKPDEKKIILENDFEIAMTRNLEREVSVMCNVSQGIEDRGIQKGIVMGKAQGIEMGIAQGIEQGIEQGIVMGAEQERLNILTGLMNNTEMPLEQLMSIMGITDAEKEKYREIFGK